MKTINLYRNYDCIKGNGLISGYIWGEILAQRGVGCECVVIFLPVCLDSQVVQEIQQILFHPGKDHINTN